MAGRRRLKSFKRVFVNQWRLVNFEWQLRLLQAVLKNAKKRLEERLERLEDERMRKH
jgi:hypothetical protein